MDKDEIYVVRQPKTELKDASIQIIRGKPDTNLLEKTSELLGGMPVYKPKGQ